jgi:hypothetical protein
LSFIVGSPLSGGRQRAMTAGLAAFETRCAGDIQHETTRARRRTPISAIDGAAARPRIPAPMTPR